MTPDPISHEQEINIIRRIVNSKAALIIFSILTSSLLTWLLTGATYAGDLSDVKDQMSEKAKIDSLNFSYVKTRNDYLMDALETSNNAIINQSALLDRMQTQLDYVQRDVEYVRKRIDKTN